MSSQSIYDAKLKKENDERAKAIMESYRNSSNSNYNGSAYATHQESRVGSHFAVTIGSCYGGTSHASHISASVFIPVGVPGGRPRY